MPILDGFGTLSKVKAVFKEANTRLTANQKESKTVVMRPTICFFSQYERNKFVHFFTNEEQPEFYLDKPLAQEELTSLLRLLTII